MPPPKKKKKADPESPAEPAGEKKEAYRVQCKAGLLTYNNSLIQSIEGLEKHHEELRAKFPNHDLELSSCVEKESRLHMHTFFSSDTKMDCDLSNFSTAMSGKVDDCKPNRGLARTVRKRGVSLQVSSTARPVTDAQNAVCAESI